MTAKMKPAQESIKHVNFPRPCGYLLLIELYITPDKVGSILIPGVKQNEDKYSNIHGRVLALGPDAYKDEVRYPLGPWCKKDDWIIFERSKGFAFNYFGKPFALINEDCVGAVIDDPAQLHLITLGDKH